MAEMFFRAEGLDTLSGGDGRDTLYGGGGFINDFFGGAGDDKLLDRFYDRMRGGQGRTR